MKKLMISFVVIEFHSLDVVGRCIGSINDVCDACLGVNYEIIVSSNSLYDVSVQSNIISRFPSVRWVFNAENNGFAYGMNRGLEVANGDFLIISNPDVVIEKGLLSMVDFMSRNDFVGACAPQIVDEGGEVQDSFRNYLSLPRFLCRQFYRIVFKKDVGLNSNVDDCKIRTIDWACGAFFMVSRDIYEMTHGLDESYFLYVEDLDWCTRIRKLGYEIVYFPEAKVVYRGSRTARRSSKFARIFMESAIIYWRRFGYFGGYPQVRNISFK